MSGSRTPAHEAVPSRPIQEADVPLLVWLEATEGRPELGALWRFLRDYVRTMAGGRFRIRLRHFPTGAGGVRHPATRLLQDSVGLAAAEREAGDADLLVYGCWGAPILETRAMLETPVTGLTEASVRVGSLYAFRPAIVTISEGLRSGMERDLAQLGALGGLLVPPVWWLDPPSTHEDVLEALDSPGPLIDRFDTVAQRAADAGADAILVGCGYLGPLFAAHGYTNLLRRPDVPVLDCCTMAYELGCLLLGMHRRGVRPGRRAYPPVPETSRTALGAALANLRDGDRRP